MTDDGSPRSGTAQVDGPRDGVARDGAAADGGARATRTPDGGAGTVERVAVTPAAARVLARLHAEHGALMIHQSGGCCDGSSPMCYPAGDLLVGDADVHLGDLAVDEPEDDRGAPTAGPVTVPVWIGRAQFEYWSHTHLTIDVVPGRGAGFSLEAPDGIRFAVRSRLLTGSADPAG